MSTLTLSKPVALTQEPAWGADGTFEVFENDSFELDIRITVSHDVRPMLALTVATCNSSCVDSTGYPTVHWP